MSPIIAVTGASGFIGQALCKVLPSKGYKVRAISRKIDSVIQGDSAFLEFTKGGDIGAQTDWSNVLTGVECVVHCAARVHIVKEYSHDSLSKYREINTYGTLHLARESLRFGVKRFIFLSSVKVNGEFSHPGRPFQPEVDFAPEDPYALSKFEAEQGLLKLARNSDMEIIIVRVPLVYGPGVKANFASLIKWVKIGLPLPFLGLRNKRSLIAIENLVDFICLCINRRRSIKAKNQIFMISDGDDVSTADLILKVAASYKKSQILFKIPLNLLRFIASITGRTRYIDSLFGSLQVDIRKTQNLLGWSPIVTMDEQLLKMAKLESENEKS